jgi:hypothetical protein
MLMIFPRPVPGLERNVLDRHRVFHWRHELDSGRAGGADQDVQPTQFPESGVDQSPALLLIGHVRLYGDRPAAQPLDLGCHLSSQVLPDVADDHVGARLGQAKRDPLADSSPTSGYNRHLIVQIHGWISFRGMVGRLVDSSSA